MLPAPRTALPLGAHTPLPLQSTQVSSQGAGAGGSSAEEAGLSLAPGGSGQERAVRFEVDTNEGSGSNPTHQTNGNGSCNGSVYPGGNGGPGALGGGGLSGALLVPRCAGLADGRLDSASLLPNKEEECVVLLLLVSSWSATATTPLRQPSAPPRPLRQATATPTATAAATERASCSRPCPPPRQLPHPCPSCPWPLPRSQQPTATAQGTAMATAMATAAQVGVGCWVLGCCCRACRADMQP